MASINTQRAAGLLLQDAVPTLGARAGEEVQRLVGIYSDLAEEWIRATGKPFVFAFWAVRKAALEDWSSEVDLGHVFRQSRDHMYVLT